MVDKPLFEFINRAAYARGAVGIPINVKLPTLGLYMASCAELPPTQEQEANQYFNINFTGPPGTASEIYFSLMFALPKWGFNVEKADEWIEVHPTHREYYERTMTTKQMLEGTIKSGLKSAAESVADYELIRHDVRKYKEILSYFAAENEHLLRSMFIDQVDIHTGEGISLRSIVPRWPTIISDFMRLSSGEDEDKTPDQIKDKYDVSKAEAVILKTKNDLYKEWRKMFKEAAMERYERLIGLMAAREKTISEYKEWLKPHISRFKMTKLGAEIPGRRAGFLRGWADIAGLSTFVNNIRIWAWRPVQTLEPRKSAYELKDRGFIIYPYDEWMRENLILNSRTGLANIYPYLMNKKNKCAQCKTFFSGDSHRCPKCQSTSVEEKTYADEIVEEQIIPMFLGKQKGLDPTELYYVFQDFDIKRVGIKLPAGETEDITFYMKNVTVTQNIILLKLLELRCREMELEKYIDKMLGFIGEEEKTIPEMMKEEFPKLFRKEEKKVETFSDRLRKDWKKLMEPYSGITKKPKTRKPGKFMFVKPGPYEKDFFERITKQYLVPAALLNNQTYNFLRGKMGMP